jgi:biopolymer transport protein ExbB
MKGGHTILDWFDHGGPLMWPLLACSVFALALVLDRTHVYLHNRLAFERFVARLHELVLGRRIDEAITLCRGRRSPIAKAAYAYLSHLDAADTSRSGIVMREGAQSLERIEKRQRGLSAVGHIATLTGLLGTVLGLVGAFGQIEVSGGQVQPADLAAGIWQALLTTVFGLSIAIPCYAAHHIFDSLADRTSRRMSYIVSYLDEWLDRETSQPVWSFDHAGQNTADRSEPVATGAEG